MFEGRTIFVVFGCIALALIQGACAHTQVKQDQKSPQTERIDLGTSVVHVTTMPQHEVPYACTTGIPDGGALDWEKERNTLFHLNPDGVVVFMSRVTSVNSGDINHPEDLDTHGTWQRVRTYTKDPDQARCWRQDYTYVHYKRRGGVTVRTVDLPVMVRLSAGDSEILISPTTWAGLAKLLTTMARKAGVGFPERVNSAIDERVEAAARMLAVEGRLTLHALDALRREFLDDVATCQSAQRSEICLKGKYVPYLTAE